MRQKIAVDPVTRLGGHLRIEVEVENGKVVDAWFSGTMARGFEEILIGKDPKEAPFVTSRICGVCFSVHQLASAKALEDAFKVDVPEGGKLIRNLIIGAEFIYDHILHFYHLSLLDYIDIVKVAEYKGSDTELLDLKDRVKALIEAQDAYPFVSQFTPDEYTIDDPEVVLILVSHYLKALKIQALARSMGAVFGGRQPHYQSIVPGGVSQYPDIEKISKFKSMLDEVAHFVKEIYIPDVIALSVGPLLPLAQSGIGAGCSNYLSCGGFEIGHGGKLLFKPGVIVEGKINKVNEFEPEKIKESVKNSWYKDSEPKHPFEGETVFDLDKGEAYSFVKAPRYDGKAFEVGPLARMFVLKEKNFMKLIEDKGIKPGVVARHLARAFETALIVDQMYRWLDELVDALDKEDFKIHNPKGFEVPEEAEGSGFFEAPRGTLAHWVIIKNKKIENYQVVAPSTWNASPRDENGVRGQCEESLIGTPVPDVKSPINVVRVIRSFDPCLACAVHLVDIKSLKGKIFVIK